MQLRPVVAIFALLCALTCRAQVAAPVKECSPSTPQICALHVLQDEVYIVTSPTRVKSGDLLWLAPFAFGTGYTLTQDVGIMQDLGYDKTRQDHFNTVSNVLGLYLPLAAPPIGYLLGRVRHDDHLQEAGMLAGEATADAVILNYGLKYAVNRQDPMQGSQTGKFWPHGLSTWPDGQSMPSNHCIIAWSFARVVASEYPGWGTKALVYSMATTVSFSRVLARQHFPSDVIVGSTFGYLIGGLVYRHRSSGGGFADNLSFAPIRTPNGKGIEVSYNFGR